MSYSSFVRELRSLMRAPYALIHLETYEEERAGELIYALSHADGRPMWNWSPVSGFDGQPTQGQIRGAFDVIAASTEPGVFVFKDASPYLEDPMIRRQLRELERECTRDNKTLIFVDPRSFEAPELQKDLTRLSMPLPHRALIGQECDIVFPQEAYPDIDRHLLISGAMGLTLREASRAFYRVRQLFDEALARNAAFDLERAILSEKQRLVGAGDALEFYPLEEGLDDVGGLDELKSWLGQRQEAFTEEARAFGLPAPKGLLLVGIQGCGKSLTAKVVGRFWGLPLLRLDLGRVFDGRRSPEESLRHALQTAEALSPCVLWLDEIEKGFAQDTDGRTTRVLGSMLTWLQEKTAPVFMVATANQVDQLPPELLRKGRFDEIFFVDLPELHERCDILKIHLRRRQRHLSDADITTLAEKCEHFSGSELEQVVVSAMYTAFAHRRDITLKDLLFAARDTVPLFRTYEEQIKALREWASQRARPASRKRRVLDFFHTPPT